MSKHTPIGTLKNKPLYQGTSPTTVKELLEEGEDMFYILGYEGVETKDNHNVIKKVARPAIYLVKRNLVGYSQVAVTDVDLGLNEQLTNKANFLLPQIPWEMEQKMSAFFHKAHELHGTESILILVYNETYLSSENPGLGWGCIAPPQENTAASCFYELNEVVMGMLHEDELIVGSAHSHPEMKAYFSHTDHADQADWDGLHITYGWFKGKADEHHIEMIAGGKEWPYQASDIFASPPIPVLDDTTDVEQWLGHVAKKAYQATSGTSQNWPGSSHPSGNSTTIKDYKSTALQKPLKKNRPMVLPANAPGPDSNILIGTLRDDALTTKDSVTCPLCNLALIKPAIAAGRCYGCRGFLAYETETIGVFYARFLAAAQIADVPELNPDTAGKPIYFFFKNGNTLNFGPDLRTANAKK